MSCNGCRVLRKGCSENCILRPCLQWIESPESQGHATVFVAKFFGRAGLMSFISAVPDSQRPALFQSLLFEAAGRTVNPVNGAVGLLWTGNWPVCQAAVETVLRGGTLRPMPELLSTGEPNGPAPTPASDDSSEVVCTDHMGKQQPQDNPIPNPNYHCRFSSSRSRVSPKRKKSDGEQPPAARVTPGQLDLRLTPGLMHRRHGTPSMNSEEESVTTTFNNNNYHTSYNISCLESNGSQEPYEIGGGKERKLLDLFV